MCSLTWRLLNSEQFHSSFPRKIRGESCCLDAGSVCGELCLNPQWVVQLWHILTFKTSEAHHSKKWHDFFFFLPISKSRSFGRSVPSHDLPWRSWAGGVNSSPVCTGRIYVFLLQPDLIISTGTSVNFLAVFLLGLGGGGGWKGSCSACVLGSWLLGSVYGLWRVGGAGRGLWGI